MTTYTNAWGCTCGYLQGFDPNDSGRQAAIFPGIPGGQCPSCREHELSALPESDQRIAITLATDAELQDIKVPVIDSDGNMEMEDAGIRYELRVDQETGAVDSVAVNVSKPRLRALNDDEIAELVQLRDEIQASIQS